MDLYFDIFSGISGNMVLGALLDLGVKLEDLQKELDKLGLSAHYWLEVEPVIKQGIAATYVRVKLNREKQPEETTEQEHQHKHKHKHEHDHDHQHNKHKHQHHDHIQQEDNQQQNIQESHHKHGRSLGKIKDIIEKSELSGRVKTTAVNIFHNLAVAEATIHNKDIEEIHFHEVGAVDAIVDIVGSAICLELLGIENVFASRINTGTGFVKCDHGIMPVPAPATLELLKEIPVYSTGLNHELVTPTGAAIISTIASEFGPRHQMQIKKTGYGAGSYDLSIPNVLRVNLISQEEKKKRLN